MTYNIFVFPISQQVNSRCISQHIGRSGSKQEYMFPVLQPMSAFFRHSVASELKKKKVICFLDYLFTRLANVFYCRKLTWKNTVIL